MNSGGHWVLATGSSSTGFNVNDPGFSKTSYTNGEVGEAAIYKPITGTPLEPVFDPTLDPAEPTWIPSDEFEMLSQ